MVPKEKWLSLVVIAVIMGGILASPDLFAQEYGSLEESIAARERALNDAKAERDRLKAEIAKADKRRDDFKQVTKSYHGAASDTNMVFIHYRLEGPLDSLIAFVSQDDLHNTVLARVYMRLLEDSRKANKEGEFYNDPGTFEKADEVARRIMGGLLEQSKAWKSHYLANEKTLMNNMISGFESRSGRLNDELARVQDRIDGLEKDLTTLRAKLAEKGSCLDLSGTWVHQTQSPACPSSTWTLKRKAGESGHVYEAAESGCGRAKGTATFSGRRLQIDWEISEACKGQYYWDLDADCHTGTGELVFSSTKAPCKGRFASTVRRGGGVAGNTAP